MLGGCWLGILNTLRSKIENEMVIPVMDGFDKNMVRKFSQLVKGMDIMRAAGKFNLHQLSSIKKRVEDGISFLPQLVN